MFDFLMFLIGTMVGLIFIFMLVYILVKIYNVFNFNKNNPWELVEENKLMIEESYHPLTTEFRSRKVHVDVYKKKKFNGTYKYKYVKRY